MAGNKEKQITMQARLPTRMSPDQMQQIARTRNLGVCPKEIAEDHGITIFAVMAIARRYDEQRQQARRISRAFQKPRQAVKAPPITTPEPDRIDRSGEYYVVHRDGMAIRLPMLSILRDAA